MSKTYIANIVAISLPLLNTMGLDLNATDLTTTLSTLAQVIAWAGIFYGRWKAGGIDVFGRKEPKI